MNFFRIAVLINILLLNVFVVGAQDATMADLRAVVAKLKSLRDYSYETVSNATFPNGQKDKKVTTMYMDGTHKRLCYKNNFQILLLTDKWAYRADHRSKNISIFDVVKYNDKYKKALPELEAVFKSNLAATFMDSVLLNTGKLTSAKKKGNQVTFNVGFPESFYVKEMVIVYDYTKQLPEMIRIKSFYGEGNKGKGTSMEMICNKYAASVPESIFDTRQYFLVAHGKAVPVQYKNYKVSSIL
jgi:outer membrane lipoprotein-sorting protein